MKNTTYLVVLCVALLSCGPSKEQHEALLKAHADSVRQMTERRMLKLQELKNSILEYEAQVEGGKNRISALKAQLEVERDRLVRIKGFQLLRTNAERDDEITRQVLLIEEIEKALLETKGHIEDIEKQLITASAELSGLEKATY
jgi:hypothetical protein